jgi:FAD/FMN-containing dehydrogenase
MRRGGRTGTLASMASLLDPPAVRDFAGELLVPGDAGYDVRRRVVDAAVDRRPALIARCAGRDDVAAALRHAREQHLLVTVRGGGHAPGGAAVADDALVVDLGRMRGVYVDPVRRRARVQGGATWRELDAATQAHGLAVTGARVPSVGVAGFTLGSGSGWLERKLGLAADALVSARLVSADGDVVTANEDEHPELFWGLRGGGAGLGVVVELEFALAPVGPRVVGGLLGWPAERTCEVAAFYGAMMAEAPDDLGGGLLLTDAPPAPFVPAALRGRPMVAVVVLWTGPAAQAEARVAPLRLLRPAFDTLGPLPYTAFQSLLEPPDPMGGFRTDSVHKDEVPMDGFRTHLDAGFLTALPSGHLDLPAPPPMSAVLLQPLGGAFARMPEDATPLGRRHAPWHWHAPAAWLDPARDGAALQWAAGVRRALAPWAAGETYPNFLSGRDPARLRAAHAPGVHARLRALRADWDPDGVLRSPLDVP